ncbi:amidohydrolase family protein [Paenibacillus sp. HJL G12]|uniref:Amidohydrolase family protein n=1 Tax=Paenibacillus dendrobii TaxID=2691084 RepID=A0A7X3LFM6_9BACL|nr:amidohydrolase [Paenibacillus dendrobii]MWV42335.1 amidohydrolase family protein [Paenibacillus dendrobii]
MGTIWKGGTIYTMKQELQTVEAVYEEMGIIKDLGDLHELQQKYHTDITEVQDLNGGVMFPGWVDSHMHLIGHGETFLKLQLGGCTSLEQVLEAVRMQTELLPEGMWVIGEGWNENEWKNSEGLERKSLDLVAPKHPVLLRRVCRHVIAVNSAALEAGGIHENVPDVAGGLVGRNADGKLNGIFKELAQELVLSAVPGVTEEYLVTALTAAIEDCWSKGLTGCHTEDLSYYGSCIRTMNAFDTVIHQNQKHFRAHLLVHHLALDEWLNAQKGKGKESPMLEFGAMKLFADGALGGRTAWLSRPYADDPSTSGVAVHSNEELEQLVIRARKQGMAVATHAIGDGAAEMVLHYLEKHPCPEGKRDRLIHGQILRSELVEQMKRLPVITDIQPSFVASDFPWVMDRIGEPGNLLIYAWKSLIEQGIPCAGGSDAPIEKVSPLEGIHAAVTRTKPQHERVYGEDERLSMYEAISLYTKGSAYASVHESDRGILEAGYAADFTVLKQDPFREGPDILLEDVVQMTVINGHIVYKNVSKMDEI